MPPTERIWIVKYALTVGPYQVDAQINDSLADVRGVSGLHAFYHGEGKEWCRTAEDAVARCEVIRAKKLASIEKSKRTIAGLDFVKMAGLK